MKQQIIKPCPFCGSSANVIMTSLAKPNGRGYLGCYDVVVKCANPMCGAVHPQGAVDTIYRSQEEAINIAITRWNIRYNQE